MEKETPVYRLLNAFMTMLLLACIGTASAGIELMRNGGSLDEACPPNTILTVTPTGGPSEPVIFGFTAGANDCYRRDLNDLTIQLIMNGSGLLSMGFSTGLGTIHIMTECCGGQELATSQL